MAETPTRARLVNFAFAVLFALFAVWCVIRAADHWRDGARGRTVLSSLAALGGASLAVRNVRRARL
jgi:hypothetical protein